MASGSFLFIEVRPGRITRHFAPRQSRRYAVLVGGFVAALVELHWEFSSTTGTKKAIRLMASGSSCSSRYAREELLVASLLVSRGRWPCL